MRYIVLFIFLLTSCGSRKVNKSESEIKDKQESVSTLIDTSKVKTNIDTNIKVISCLEDSEIKIIPADTSKELVVDGIKYKNAILSINNRKDKQSINIQKKESKIEDKRVFSSIKNKRHLSVKKSDKHVERKDSLLNYWWVLLLIVIGYITYRKYIK